MVDAIAKIISGAPFPSERSRNKARAALAVARPVIREECAKVAHEQRCERDTPWDHACLAIAAAIRAMIKEKNDD
jgi:hypothetical protein